MSRTLIVTFIVASFTAVGGRAVAEPDADSQSREPTKDGQPPGTGELVVASMDDQDWRRPGGRYRTAFWATLAGVGVGVLATTAAVSHVRSLEDDKLDLSIDLHNEIEFDSTNVCLAAEGASSPTARELVSVCDSGRRWATISNGLMLGTALTAVAAGYLYYKGYLEPPTSAERLRVSPTVSTSSASIAIALDF